MPTRTFLLALCICLPIAAVAADPPKAGDKAPDFTLNTLDDQTVQLSELTKQGPVVLVVLRGWPGYQCPACDGQVHDFIKSAPSFAAAKAQVVFVYPGPAKELTAHAAEFKSWKGRQWPTDFLFALDPDYTFTTAYHLRWDAPKETAYPATFVIDQHNLIRHAKISHTHGDRAKASDILTEVKNLAGAK
jgi:peroxiredoxin Q/BCP